MYLSLIFSLSISLSSYAQTPDPECKSWFESSKLQAGTKSCEIECASLIADMQTFICPNQCDLLCKKKKKNQMPVVGNFIYYPGLTPVERALVKKRPNDAFTVFIQKNRAERSTRRNFPNQNLNDESDAFRHFVWAGLLTKKLGETKAKEFLDAHEADPAQTKEQLEMDLLNNRYGQKSAQKLISKKKWSLKNLELAGFKKLRAKKLKVLEPGLKIPKEPK